VIKIEIIFYSSEDWESSGSRRVACDSGADSILQFCLKREGDRKKCCWKMKQR
jgi:hypothetical protein